MDKEQKDSLSQVIAVTPAVLASPGPLQSEALGPLMFLQQTRQFPRPPPSFRCSCNHLSSLWRPFLVNPRILTHTLMINSKGKIKYLQDNLHPLSFLVFLLYYHPAVADAFVLRVEAFHS